ncbi:S66 peptidase family protein [Pseudobdellovibrio exovorus]|uniref:Microcin C7 self-immunity protein n=1 Tax=Pseudobdellovibrio exovorus JSS TaxID=1184267 RepID=M4VC22_9BACT|nr:LD-carboxypeptidase [Pseudobdellovibrio exovorus]AGH95571.1 microcin C7 self-immunity protein [Pseudobdellovibrio exovorus JSS]
MRAVIRQTSDVSSKKKNPKKKSQITKVKTVKNKKRAIRLDALSSGDLIEVVAPGSYSPEENLQKGIKELQALGYEVSSDPSTLQPHLNFLSNTDHERFRFLKKALMSSKNKGVWCLRGGYGAIRLLPFLDKMKAPSKPKLLIGLSDVTSLHIYVTQKWGWPTLHAPLLDRLALKKLSKANLGELQSALEDANYVAEFKDLEPLNSSARKRKSIKSSVIGGNLMVLTSTLGTPYQIKTEGKILFIEEVSERAYRIDRCLQQLKQAGIFKGVQAVVFGDMTACDEPNKENYLDETLKSFFADAKFPVFRGVETGHGEIQRPLFFNTETHISCGDSARMLVYSAFK